MVEGLYIINHPCYVKGQFTRSIFQKRSPTPSEQQTLLKKAPMLDLKNIMFSLP